MENINEIITESLIEMGNSKEKVISSSLQSITFSYDMLIFIINKINNTPKLTITISGDVNVDNLKLSGYFNMQNAEIKKTDKTDADEKLREVCMKNFGYFGDGVQIKINEIINVAKNIYLTK